MDKKKGKDNELLLGGTPASMEPTEEELAEQEKAEHQHRILTENIEEKQCPYHGQPLKIQSERIYVDELDENNRPTGKKKYITQRFAVCNCSVKGANPYRGRRVWSQT